MKKFNTWLKNRLSPKKHANHTDPAKNSSMRKNLQEKWSKLMHSNHNKVSEGASEYTRAIRSRGGSNSKISGREHDKGHHKVYHNKPPKK